MFVEILILAGYTTFIAIGMTEGLYYLNFSPFSFFRSWERYGILPNPYQYIFGPLILLAFFLILGLLMNARFPKFKGLKNYILASAIIFLLCNLALSFDEEFMLEMAFLGQLSLFFTIIVVFDTFFYSIFYRNLVK